MRHDAYTPNASSICSMPRSLRQLAIAWLSSPDLAAAAGHFSSHDLNCAKQIRGEQAAPDRLVASLEGRSREPLDQATLMLSDPGLPARERERLLHICLAQELRTIDGYSGNETIAIFLAYARYCYSRRLRPQRAPECHRYLLARNNFAIPFVRGVDDVALQLVRDYGYWLEALANMQLEPQTALQHHFVHFCQGHFDPLFAYEIAWAECFGYPRGHPMLRGEEAREEYEHEAEQYDEDLGRLEQRILHEDHVARIEALYDYFDDELNDSGE